MAMDDGWREGALAALEEEMMPLIALLLDMLAPETWDEYCSENRVPRVPEKALTDSAPSPII